MPLNSGQVATQVENQKGKSVLRSKERAARTCFRTNQASSRVQSFPAKGVGECKQRVEGHLYWS